jgi:ABC-2 type transport system permease protein
MGVRQMWINAQIQFQELVRLPAFTAPTLGLPLITYAIFGLPAVRGDSDAAAAVYVGFAAFALLGIVMFQFGVGIAADRSSPWERYVRTLPSSDIERFVARLVVALGFGIASVLPVTLCALAATPLSLTATDWVRIAFSLTAGAIPLGLLGIMLGYLLPERGALPVTNLIYLPLAFVGGLFSPTTNDLPALVRQIAPWLPTRQWSELLVQFGLRGRFPVHAVAGLAGYAALFAAVALVGYRRDEQKQYR